MSQRRQRHSDILVAKFIETPESFIPKFPPCIIWKQLPQENDFKNQNERKENNISTLCPKCQRAFLK